MADLYTYPVPELSPDGSCSVAGKLAENSYDLREVLGESPEVYKKLQQLDEIVDRLHQDTKVDWVGIYQVVGKVLVKLVYRGAPSRAEFPLTEEFAKKSNNSTVGLTGKVVVFNDLAQYNGPYYECDGKVQSEACVPIVNEGEQVLGIIDAESFSKDHFAPHVVKHITRVADEVAIVLVAGR